MPKEPLIPAFSVDARPNGGLSETLYWDTQGGHKSIMMSHAAGLGMEVFTPLNGHHRLLSEINRLKGTVEEGSALLEHEEPELIKILERICAS